MSMRPRRCPLPIVLLVYGLHAVLALAFSWPLANLIADRVAAHPRGDLILLEPSGMYLTEVLRMTRGSLASVTAGGRFALLAVAFLGLLPLGAMLYAIAFEGPLSLRVLLAAAGRFFAPLSLLLGISVAGFALVSLFPDWAAALLEGKVRSAAGDHVADLVKAGIWCAGLAVAAVIGITHDLARAAVVSRDLPALPAAWAGLATFHAFPGRALAGWGLRAAAGALLVTAAAFVTTKIGVQTGPRLLATAIVHQMIALPLVWLRADWLAHAVTLGRALHAAEEN